MTLDYTGKTFADAYSIPDSEWQSVPLKTEKIDAGPQGTGPTLPPAQELTLLAIDLRDLFDVSRPGTYRVQAHFHDPEGITGESDSGALQPFWKLTTPGEARGCPTRRVSLRWPA